MRGLLCQLRQYCNGSAYVGCEKPKEEWYHPFQDIVLGFKELFPGDVIFHLIAHSGNFLIKTCDSII